MKTETATFAMGCFWQPDYIFSKVKGVIAVKVGYTGCNAGCVNPTYEEVCSDKTICAEAVEISFNPSIISYSELLDLFWINHDPTTINRQGFDIGVQYRSAIFYHNGKQKKEALASKAKWEKKLIDKSKEIATEITPSNKFYSAEDYHQKYLAKTGRACHIAKQVFR